MTSESEFAALREVALRHLETTEDVCSQENCDRKRKYRRTGLCGTHYARLRKHGDPNVVLKGGFPIEHGPANPNWRGSTVGYSGAHMRVRSLNGKASDHWCNHCAERAGEWAYDHSDPEERRDPHTGFAYSTDESHYIPLCRPCHRKMDLNEPRGV